MELKKIHWISLLGISEINFFLLYLMKIFWSFILWISVWNIKKFLNVGNFCGNKKFFVFFFVLFFDCPRKPHFPLLLHMKKDIWKKTSCRGERATNLKHAISLLLLDYITAFVPVYCNRTLVWQRKSRRRL